MGKEKDLRELAGDVVQAVFDLSNSLEERDGLDMGISQHRKPIRKIVSEALINCPQNAIDLVLECLVAEASVGTEEEAKEKDQQEYMDLSDSDS